MYNRSFLVVGCNDVKILFASYNPPLINIAGEETGLECRFVFGLFGIISKSLYNYALSVVCSALLCPLLSLASLLSYAWLPFGVKNRVNPLNTTSETFC